MKWLDKLDTAGRWVRRLSEILTAIAFGLVVVAFAYGVTSRYIFGSPSRNADEIATILFLWVVIFGAGFAVAPDDHVSVDLVSSRLGDRASRYLVGLGSLVAAIIFLYALPTTLDYVRFLRREMTPALRLPLSITYFCFVLFQGAVGVTLLLRAIRLFFGGSSKSAASSREEAF